MKENAVTVKDLFVSAFLVLLVILTCFNFYVFSISFHKSLINSYSTNESYYEIDKNTTRFVTGFDFKYDSPFNQNEISHMTDVRNIIVTEEIIYLILIITLLIFLFTGQIQIFKNVKLCAIIIIVIVLVLSVIMNFFDAFFNVFHKFLFPQGNWQFPSDSLMIQIYHESFFQNFLFYTIVTAAAVIFISFVVLQIIRHSLELKKLSKKKD